MAKPHCPCPRGVPAMTRRGLALLLVALAAVPTAGRTAQDWPRATEAVKSGMAARVIDGDTLALDSGLHVRLVGIQAPKLPLGRPGFAKWPLADESKAALEALTLGKALTLGYGGRRIDRYGRLLAHLTAPGGAWVQGEMLARGMARVYSFADNRSRIPDMLAREAEARASKRGIWAHPYYAVRTPDEAGRHIGSFQIVQGRVVSAAVARKRGYLNFGPDWKTDFTISIAPRDMRRFRAAGQDIAAYKDRVVRVRGWLRRYNGPMIEVTHPEQIELLP
jgi:micrococcal nuclease